MATAAAVTSEFIAVATALYDAAASNEDRHFAVSSFEQLRARTPPQVLAQACVQVAQSDGTAPVVAGLACHELAALFAFGAGGGGAGQRQQQPPRGFDAVSGVPFAAMARFVAGAPPFVADERGGACGPPAAPGCPGLSQPLVAGIAKVCSAAALQAWPHEWPDMLDTLCPENVAEHPSTLLLLEAVVTAVASPPVGSMNPRRLGPLKKAMGEAAHPLLMRIATAAGQLFGFFTSSASRLEQARASLRGAGGANAFADPAGDAVAEPLLRQAVAALGAERRRALASLHRCVDAAAAVIPYLTMEQWWAAHVAEMVMALLEEPTTATMAAGLVGVLAACNVGRPLSVLPAETEAQRAAAAAASRKGVALLAAVCAKIAAVAACGGAVLQPYSGAVDTVIAALRAMEDDQLRALTLVGADGSDATGGGGALVQMIVAMANTHSVVFAGAGFELAARILGPGGGDGNTVESNAFESPDGKVRQYATPGQRAETEAAARNAVAQCGDALVEAAVLRCRKYEGAPDWKGHPHPGNAEAATWAREQCPSVDEYDAAFSEQRANVGKALGALVAVAPAQAAVVAASVLRGVPSRGLPPLAGPPAEEPRSRFGWITQRGPTFIHWEAVNFVFSHLASSFASPVAAPNAMAALDTLLGEPLVSLADAVLVPVYLNTVASLWMAPVPHWGQSLAVLQRCLILEPHPHGGARRVSDDEDLIAARKRAATLLVKAAAEHGAALAGGPLASTMMESFQRLMISSHLMPSETTYVYEASAALTNHMDPARQAAALRDLLHPHKATVADIVGEAGVAGTGEGLAMVLVGETRDLAGQRNRLKAALQVLTAVLHRCRGSEPVRELARQYIDLYGRTLLALHSVAPFLPANLVGAIQTPDPAGQVIRGGGPRRRPPPDRGSEEGRLRSTVLNLAQSLYKGVQIMSSMLNVVPYFLKDLCDIVLNPAARAPMQTVRALGDHLVLPALTSHPEIIAVHVLPRLGEFFASRAAYDAADRDTLADNKTASFLMRDTLQVVKGPVAALGPVGLQAAASFLTQAAMSGLDLRAVAREAVAFASASPHERDSHTLLAVVIACAVRHPRTNPNERSMVIDWVSDGYVKHFPDWRPAFIGGPSNSDFGDGDEQQSQIQRLAAAAAARGFVGNPQTSPAEFITAVIAAGHLAVPPFAVRQLHAHLSAGGRPFEKRKTFAGFITEQCSPRR